MNSTKHLWIFLFLLLGHQPYGNAQLSGDYTIGDTNCTFKTVQRAVDSLLLSGTAGNVYFKIKPGVYTGFNLSGFQPTHAPDTVFFQSESLVANDVKICGIIRVTNSTAIWFRYVRFEPGSGQQYSCVGLSGASSVQFSHCAFINPFQNCFTSQEALFSINFPFTGSIGVATLNDCVLSSPAYTIYLSGARGSITFLHDTINGAIDCFPSGYSVNYTENLFNLTSPALSFAGQTFHGNTFNCSTLYIQGDCYNNIFYCSVEMFADKIYNNHFYSLFIAQHSPGIRIFNNIFEQKFDLEFCSGATIARNRFFSEAIFNSDYSSITGNFFYGFTECATGPGYQIKHNNFHPDADLEMWSTSGTVENNIIGSMAILQYGITKISNNNFIPNVSASVNVYGINASFYDPGYISMGDLHATNPALIRKSTPRDNTPGMMYDIDSIQRKTIPTIGANEICFTFQTDTIKLKCDNVCLDLCMDPSSAYFWTPSSLFGDSTSLSPVIHPDSSCKVYLNKTGVGVIDSVFLDVTQSLPIANGTALVNNLLGHFTNMSVCADSILWAFGDGTYAKGNDVYHNFPTYGMYRSKLHAFNQSGEDSLTFTLFLTCLSSDTLMACGDSLRIRSCIEDFTGYYWSPSYLVPDSLQATPLLFPETNDVVYLHNIHWPEMVAKYIYVFPAAPTSSLQYAVDSLNVSFTSTTKCADSVRWDFGDGISSTDNNPVHLYPSWGVYDGKLFAYSLLGSDTARFSINITGISSVVESGFEIWPNPAGEYLVIDPLENIKEYSIFISDLLGREIYKSKGNHNRTQIDLISFSQGVYFIMMQSAGYSFSKKIILQ